MDRLSTTPRSPWRSWPLLVAGLLVGSMALTPAVSFAGKFLKKSKAVKLFEEETDASTRYVRIASASDPDVAFTGPPGVGGGTDGTVLTTTISAPGPGFLVIGASSQTVANNTDSTECILRVDGTGVESSRRILALDTNDPEICATDATQQVAGGPHTVELRALGAGGSTVEGTWGPASMSVLFVALGATGGLGA